MCTKLQLQQTSGSLRLRKCSGFKSETEANSIRVVISGTRNFVISLIVFSHVARRKVNWTKNSFNLTLNLKE